MHKVRLYHPISSRGAVDASSTCLHKKAAVPVQMRPFGCIIHGEILPGCFILLYVGRKGAEMRPFWLAAIALQTDSGVGGFRHRSRTGEEEGEKMI